MGSTSLKNLVAEGLFFVKHCLLEAGGSGSWKTTAAVISACTYPTRTNRKSYWFRPSKLGFGKNITNGHRSPNSTATRTDKTIGTEREITTTLYWMEMLKVVHNRAAGHQHLWLPGTESLAVNRAAQQNHMRCIASKQWATSFPTRGSMVHTTWK
jgi:hypothetical protein